MKMLIALAAMLAGSMAFAQQMTQPPSEQALFSMLNQDIGLRLQCETSAAVLRRQLAEAQAQIKELQDKYEPKK